MCSMYSNLELVIFATSLNLVFFLWFFLLLLLKENCSYIIYSEGLFPKIVFRVEKNEFHVKKEKGFL